MWKCTEILQQPNCVRSSFIDVFLVILVKPHSDCQDSMRKFTISVTILKVINYSLKYSSCFLFEDEKSLCWKAVPCSVCFPGCFFKHGCGIQKEGNGISLHIHHLTLLPPNPPPLPFLSVLNVLNSPQHFHQSDTHGSLRLSSSPHAGLWLKTSDTLQQPGRASTNVCLFSPLSVFCPRPLAPAPGAAAVARPSGPRLCHLHPGSWERGARGHTWPGSHNAQGPATMCLCRVV